MLSGALIILILIAAVPAPSGVALHLQEHIPILLVVPRYQIARTIGYQSK
jgi:hypothetical protein